MFENGHSPTEYRFRKCHRRVCSQYWNSKTAHNCPSKWDSCYTAKQAVALVHYIETRPHVFSLTLLQTLHKEVAQSALLSISWFTPVETCNSEPAYFTCIIYVQHAYENNWTRMAIFPLGMLFCERTFLSEVSWMSKGMCNPFLVLLTFPCAYS